MLVKKRITYAFSLFVHGHYNSRNNAEIMRLFDNMKVEEKLDILSMNFNQMWYRIWGHATISSAYLSSKTKFESLFLCDGVTDKLQNMISRSTCRVVDVWEIPKGRKKSRAEYDMNCAVREFFEETGISHNQYRILPNATRQHEFVDREIRYKNKYFIAVARENISPKINMRCRDQIGEVCDIRWVDIEDMRVLDPSGRLEAQIRPIFNYVKKHVIRPPPT
jgi:hypothetical protein